MYFAPSWALQARKARDISEALSKESKLSIKPRIAKSYPQILDAFTRDEPVLVYVGSFVQAILKARDLSVPIGQGITGKHQYASVLIAPEAAGSDPVEIVKNCGLKVAYAKGASSGESGAQAATGGQASLATNSHSASLNALKAGKAKCAFVKDHWWEDNGSKYPGMKMHKYPGVSDKQNPDFVLSANKAVGENDIIRIKMATGKTASAFGVATFRELSPDALSASLELMRMGKIDPLKYTW
ncbi:MAG: phosphate/phosphite/phosphonate ABC transporter substrate-binding protein [Deltaproteobacteria bacterium]|nr:phosphate/phosphite/phosphonate ABC transporter substrate-binding protein [Deltaproteobacteria bacterium]